MKHGPFDRSRPPRCGASGEISAAARRLGERRRHEPAVHDVAMRLPVLLAACRCRSSSRDRCRPRRSRVLRPATGSSRARSIHRVLRDAIERVRLEHPLCFSRVEPDAREPRAGAGRSSSSAWGGSSASSRRSSPTPSSRAAPRTRSGRHRREVTVVFADLRGFTAFAETAAPEEVMAVLREYHGEMGRLILAHEGTLERFTGDGLMVFFNDPIPVPDAAERAVRMAVAMRDARRRADREVAPAKGTSSTWASASPGATRRSGRSASRDGGTTRRWGRSRTSRRGSAARPGPGRSSSPPASWRRSTSWWTSSRSGRSRSGGSCARCPCSA